MLVQGAGGNVSAKHGRRLIVKASGTWLSRALEGNIFVECDLDGLCAAARGEDEDLSAHVLDGSDMRPSIEALLHASLPHHVVAHVHSIRTLAWAVRRDGEEALAARLAGLRWAWVPYRRPGLPLARVVQSALADQPDVLVLANHGLIVGADSCAAAEALIADVEERLDIPARPLPPLDIPALERFAATEGLGLPRHAEVHCLANDRTNLAIVRRGPLYPDHVVFLGTHVPVVAKDQTVGQARAAVVAPPKYWVLEGRGVLVEPAMSDGGEEMLLCLAQLARHIDPGADLAVLTSSETDSLQNWEAEKFRQALDMPAFASP